MNVLIVYDHSSSMTSRVSGGTATRADQVEDVVYDFVHSLFGYQSSTNPSNIQVGLVRFARTARTQTDLPVDHYYNTGNTEALSAAIDEIFHQIVEALGIHSVSIHDGTTNQVRS